MIWSAKSSWQLYTTHSGLCLLGSAPFTISDHQIAASCLVCFAAEIRYASAPGLITASSKHFVALASFLRSVQSTEAKDWGAKCARQAKHGMPLSIKASCAMAALGKGPLRPFVIKYRTGRKGCVSLEWRVKLLKSLRRGRRPGQ